MKLIKFPFILHLVRLLLREADLVDDHADEADDGDSWDHPGRHDVSLEGSLFEPHKGQEREADTKEQVDSEANVLRQPPLVRGQGKPAKECSDDEREATLVPLASNSTGSVESTYSNEDIGVHQLEDVDVGSQHCVGVLVLVELGGLLLRDGHAQAVEQRLDASRIDH